MSKKLLTPFKLSIKLDRAPVPITRKVLVPGNIDMYELHFVIQAAMGWDDDHLFEFFDKRGYDGVSSTDGETADEMGGDNIHDAEGFSLSDFLERTKDGKHFHYEYDFGDGWLHKLSVLKPSKQDLEIFDGRPICISAEGACPPEDIGGVWGYANFLGTVKDKNHPDYEDMRDWAGLEPGEAWDPHAVDLEMINDHLRLL